MKRSEQEGVTSTRAFGHQAVSFVWAGGAVYIDLDRFSARGHPAHWPFKITGPDRGKANSGRMYGNVWHTVFR